MTGHVYEGIKGGAVLKKQMLDKLMCTKALHVRFILAFFLCFPPTPAYYVTYH